jgi:acetyl/propionyl-CoA carboxylase alpha subunit
LCVWAPNRPQALARMRRALFELEIEGLGTNLDFHRALLNVPAFVQGKYDTGFIAEHLDALTRAEPERDSALAAAVLVLTEARRAGARPSRADQASDSGWVQAYRRFRLGAS